MEALNQQNNTPIRPRKISTAVNVGDVTIGGGSPVVVQAMTDTSTADIKSTTQQILELAQAGSEIVRITVNNAEAAQAVPAIAENIKASDCPVPLVGDFHFNGHRLLEQHPECGIALDKLRINPGNVGKGKRRDTQFTQMIEFACRYQKPVRIGANWGSLDQDLLAKKLDANARQKNASSLDTIVRETLIASALDSARFAEDIGLAHNQIIVSCKVSKVNELIQTYQQLSNQCDYALHLGLTEAGMGRKGIVASTTALAILLNAGIGDTIRVSLTPEPGANRNEEVRVAWSILQSLDLRHFTPEVTACPGCGRTNSDYFQHLAQDIQSYIEQQLPTWKIKHKGVENMTVAVMGCVVNGPGESKHADIGISLPGSGEHPAAPVYINGERHITLKGDTIAADFKQLVENYVNQTFPPTTR